jgi:hypothetical protein
MALWRKSALSQGLISEETIKDALTTARGDIFLSACYLGVSVRELHTFLRASESLQAFVGAIDRVKHDSEYDKLTKEQFEDQLDILTKSLHIEALDIIHGMAVMNFDSAAMAEVKLKAAIQLKSTKIDARPEGENALVLQELNKLYRESAPRIRSIRAVQVEYEPQP